MAARITQKQLKDWLDYDPDTGVFRWKVARGRMPAGAIAGSTSKGRVWIGLGNTTLQASQAAFLWMTGKVPVIVDHKDRQSLNNAWRNLRAANGSQNIQNSSRRSDNTSGFKGVSYRADRGKWRAYIMVQGRFISLGHFDNIEDAKESATAGRIKYHGEFANHD